MTPNEIKQEIWKCSWMSKGEAPSEKDYAYWEGKYPELEARGVEIGIPDYAERRLLGWQASGADAPLYGEYATPPTPYHAVPPREGEVVAEPPSVNPPSPPTQALGVDEILAAIAALSAKLDQHNLEYKGAFKATAALFKSAFPWAK